jgi:ferrous iron transport protein B
MSKESKKMLVAVAGQPNSGKSTIFNILTGARQHVANYPGVTVEKKTGSYHLKEDTVELVDLPGTYSLTSYTHLQPHLLYPGRKDSQRFSSQ